MELDSVFLLIEHRCFVLGTERWDQSDKKKRESGASCFPWQMQFVSNKQTRKQTGKSLPLPLCLLWWISPFCSRPAEPEPCCRLGTPTHSLLQSKPPGPRAQSELGMDTTLQHINKPAVPYRGPVIVMSWAKEDCLFFTAGFYYCCKTQCPDQNFITQCRLHRIQDILTKMHTVQNPPSTFTSNTPSSVAYSMTAAYVCHERGTVLQIWSKTPFNSLPSSNFHTCNIEKNVGNDIWHFRGCISWPFKWS